MRRRSEQERQWQEQAEAERQRAEYGRQQKVRQLDQEIVSLTQEIQRLTSRIAKIYNRSALLVGVPILAGVYSLSFTGGENGGIVLTIGTALIVLGLGLIVRRKRFYAIICGPLLQDVERGKMQLQQLKRERENLLRITR